MTDIQGLISTPLSILKKRCHSVYTVHAKSTNLSIICAQIIKRYVDVYDHTCTRNSLTCKINQSMTKER